MKKIIFLIAFFFLFIKNSIIFANEASKEAGQSAIISYKIKLQEKNKDFFYKKLSIKNIFDKYNSPLSSSVDSFINSCIKYDFNCYLLPAIAGLESTFGRFILPNSYNPFGWGGGYIIFKNWDEAIESVASGLYYNYYNYGLNTIELIAPVYSESLTWAQRVRYFINQFKKEEEKIRLYFEKNPVYL